MATADAPFSRVLPLRKTVEPKCFDLRADRAECEAVRALLDVPAVADLRVAGEIVAVDDCWRLQGAVEASVVQTCVVTFEPVASDVVATFDRWLVVGDAEVGDAGVGDGSVANVRAGDDGAGDDGAGDGGGDHDGTPAGGDIDPDEPDIDRLATPEVDVGVVAVEELALSLEPYPRSPAADATLAAVRDEPSDDRPFAALARRRGRS